MSDRLRTIIALAVSVAALAVIGIGLVGGPAPAPTPDERVAALAASIKCPFCDGESLADSGSGVAADYRALIAERVASGATDAEIRQEFADNFGASIVLDTSSTPWAIALWAVPALVLIAGLVAVATMRNAARRQAGGRASRQDRVDA
jgi:cytochrome c-type biogenesis protein CcmH